MSNGIGLLLSIVAAVGLLMTSPIVGRPSARHDDADPFFDSASEKERTIVVADGADAIAVARTRRGVIYDTVAAMCAWINRYTGYGCDDPVARALWRRYIGASDCNGFCRKKGHRGGRCISGGTDRSSWCPRGQRCSCD